MSVTTSAPAKVILAGGKAVNYGYPALVAAVGLRTFCTLGPDREGRYAFEHGDRIEEGDQAGLRAFRARVDALRAAKNYDAISAIARDDYFAPARYVLSFVVDRTRRLGWRFSWRSEVPVGSGLGSGAAASASMALAALHAARVDAAPADVAWHAWQGDVIAHGGMGSGLDSGASALGGFVRYTLDAGPSSVTAGAPLRLVIGDTLLRASTAASNTSSRNWLAEHPGRMHLMADMGMVVERMQAALERGDLETVGRCMNLCHLIKEKIGMSIPKIESMIEAALGAGALGAKISGKGSGGIIIALVRDGDEAKIAASIERAGGKAILAEVGTFGARVEDET